MRLFVFYRREKNNVKNQAWKDSREEISEGAREVPDDVQESSRLSCLQSDVFQSQEEDEAVLRQGIRIWRIGQL